MADKNDDKEDDKVSFFVSSLAPLNSSSLFDIEDSVSAPSSPPPPSVSVAPAWLLDEGKCHAEIGTGDAPSKRTQSYLGDFARDDLFDDLSSITTAKR